MSTYFFRISICLAFGSLLWACNNEKPSHVEEKPDSTVVIPTEKWITGVDTVNKMIISYSFPERFRKDIIQNGLCFGNPNTGNRRFPNDMKLCIWLNQESPDNVEDIIQSEGTGYPFNVNIKRDSMQLNDSPALKVQYLKEGTDSVVKNIIFFDLNSNVYQIIANEVPSGDFDRFMSQLKIERLNKKKKKLS